jgi:diguanylate cyclase (GGDEF)-like protein
VRLRSRLAFLLLIIVVGPVIGGVVAARALAVRQSSAVAEARLEGGSAFVRAAVEDLNHTARDRLASRVALQAVRERTSSSLDSLRRSARLDYLVVDAPAGLLASMRTPLFDKGVAVTPTILAGGARRIGLVSESRIKVLGSPGGVVWGGMFRDRTFLLSLPTEPLATVAGGRAVAVTPPGPRLPTISELGAFDAGGSWRGFCVCAGATPSGIALLTTRSSVGVLPPLRATSVAIAVAALLTGLAFAFALAKLVSRPIQQLADDTTESIRTELDLLREDLDEWEAEELEDAEPTRADEVARLSEAFQTLRQGLRRAAGQLGGSKEELRETRARLSDQERLSLSDSLTGTWNRRYLEMAMSDAMQRARRMGHPFATLMIDIDRFKSINDRHGHPRGDEVLVELCRRIRGALRANLDVLARYGGEEFVVLLPETGPAGAAVVARKIHTVVRDQPFGSQGRGIDVTVSVGVSSYPEDGGDADAVLAAADANLYAAKRTGRDRVVVSRDSARRR